MIECAMRYIDAFFPMTLLGVALAVTTIIGGCKDDDPYGGVTFEGEFGQPLPFELHAGLIFVDVDIDGSGPRPFIVDSGAQYVLLESSFAQELGYTGVVNDLDEMELGSLRFSGVDGVPYDLAPIEQTLGVDLDGIIGASLLQYFTLVIDYQESALTLLDIEEETNLVDSSRVDERPLEAPFELGFGLPLASASFESAAPAQFVIDTGASTVAIFRSYFDTLDTGDRPLLEGSEGLSAAGTFTVDMTRFCGIEVGDAHAPDVPVSVIGDTALGDIRSALPELEGLLGYTFLRDFMTVLDYPDGSARFYRFAERTHVLDDEFVRAGFVLRRTDGGEVEVATVHPDTDAEAQGLEEGDEILQVNNRRAENMSLEELSGALYGDVGDTVILDVDRGGTSQRFEILIENLLPACEG